MPRRRRPLTPGLGGQPGSPCARTHPLLDPGVSEASARCAQSKALAPSRAPSRARAARIVHSSCPSVPCRDRTRRRGAAGPVSNGETRPGRPETLVPCRPVSSRRSTAHRRAARRGRRRPRHFPRGQVGLLPGRSRDHAALVAPHRWAPPEGPHRRLREPVRRFRSGDDQRQARRAIWPAAGPASPPLRDGQMGSSGGRDRGQSQ
jgi:hypothetical protein